MTYKSASVAEQVDALDLKSNSGFGVSVRFRSFAPLYNVEGWQSWSIVPVLKTGEVKASEGSNPLPSAIIQTNHLNFFNFKWFIQRLYIFVGGIAKLVMPRIANPTCVGSSPTTSSTFPILLLQYKFKSSIKSIFFQYYTFMLVNVNFYKLHKIGLFNGLSIF